MQYNIEDNIDFYSELLKIQSNTTDTDKTQLQDNVDDLCLISNTILTDNYVTLICGHKFNYIPLYYDIYNHKTKYNIKEKTYDKLKYYEIRCPYCRKKQNELLPYYPELIPDKIHGVNYIDENYLMVVNDYKDNIFSKYSQKKKKKTTPSPDNTLLCQTILKYGLNKGEKCNKHIFNENYCKRHYTLNNKVIKD
jgi:hypothetical protein